MVCPADGSNDSDMRSILSVMAIKSVAPHVRTVAEVNNPRHVEHFQRAHADEISSPRGLAPRGLLARSALYPGLAELVADIVSGGEGSELYRVEIPAEYVGLRRRSARLRGEHRATLLPVSRGGRAYVNPPKDFRLAPGDDPWSWPSRWAPSRRSSSPRRGAVHIRRSELSGGRWGRRAAHRSRAESVADGAARGAGAGPVADGAVPAAGRLRPRRRYQHHC